MTIDEIKQDMAAGRFSDTAVINMLIAEVERHDKLIARYQTSLRQHRLAVAKRCAEIADDIKYSNFNSHVTQHNIVNAIRREFGLEEEL